MSRRASPAAVGAFVLVGLAILVAGILVFGGGRLFRPTVRYAVFFEGSVNGLAVGSPVKVAGVPVGQVIEIDAIVDAREWTLLTEAVIELDLDRLTRRGVGVEVQIPHHELIAHGLRARLEMQSLLTGQLYVELSFRPDTQAKLAGRDTRYQEIPSLPTTVQEIEAEVRQVLAKLAALPIQDLAEKLDSALAGVDRLVNDPSIPRSLASLDAALVEARQAMHGVAELSQQARGEIGPLARTATATLDDARRTLEDVRGQLGSGSPLSYQLSATLKEFDRALEAIRIMAQQIERDPRSVILGRSEHE